MDGFRLFFATSGPEKRRKQYVCLLFSQYWVCYFSILSQFQDGTSIRKKQFRDYHAWNRIEKLMPQHYTNFLKLLKLYATRPTCFQTLIFCRNLSFQKPWICPWIFHGFPTPWPGSLGPGISQLQPKGRGPGGPCVAAPRHFIGPQRHLAMA